MKTIVILMMCVVLGGCGRNIEEAKRCGPVLAKQQGFEVVGYQGYNLSVIYGGLVWYTMRRVPDNGITYQAAFSPWFGECMMYSLEATDAIKP